MGNFFIKNYENSSQGERSGLILNLKLITSMQHIFTSCYVNFWSVVFQLLHRCACAHTCDRTKKNNICFTQYIWHTDNKFTTKFVCHYTSKMLKQKLVAHGTPLERVEKSRFILITLTPFLYYSDQTSTWICLTPMAFYSDQVSNWALGSCSM